MSQLELSACEFHTEDNQILRFSSSNDPAPLLVQCRQLHTESVRSQPPAKQCIALTFETFLLTIGR